MFQPDIRGAVTGNDDGIVLDYTVEQGNPPDAPQLAPAIARVAKRTGKTPRTVTAERSYGGRLRVVARAGIPGLLDAHPSVDPVHLGVKAKFPDGWEANQAILSHLSQHRVPAA